MKSLVTYLLMQGDKFYLRFHRDQYGDVTDVYTDNMGECATYSRYEHAKQQQNFLQSHGIYVVIYQNILTQMSN